MRVHGGHPLAIEEDVILRVEIAIILPDHIDGCFIALVMKLERTGIHIINVNTRDLKVGVGRPIHAILVEQNSEPHQQPAAPALTAQPVPDPVLDEDDDITLDIRAVQGGDSTQNFVSSVLAISGG